MKRINIIKDNLSLDIVKPTFSLKYENNSLSVDWKGNYSSYPFLIVENEKTKQALGPSDITSLRKNKTVDVVVYFAGEKFSGKLQQLTFINGFRKCNLKFYSEIIEITSLKIGSFMPIVSVIPGETAPIPFTDEIEDYLPGAENWATYPVPFISQGWPDVKWQFPQIVYNQTNQFNFPLSAFLLNEAQLIGDEVVALNRSNPSPHVYLLSPLFYTLESIGYRMSGDFPSHPLIQRIIIHSKNMNISETLAKALIGNVTWAGAPWQTSETSPGVEFKRVTFPIQKTGTYIIELDLTETPPHDISSGVVLPLEIYVDETFYTVYNPQVEQTDYTMWVKFSFESDTDLIGKDITFIWKSAVHRIPAHIITIKLAQSEKLNFQHPTIDLSRYVPDWTFSEYITNLKNLFNLRVSSDDVAKKLVIDFNEFISDNEIKEIINKNLFIEEYDIAAVEQFVLSYDNDADNYVSITNAAGIQTNSKILTDFSNDISNKFKFIDSAPFIGAIITDEIEDRSGIGLLIYDPVSKPYTIPDYAGYNLSMDKPGGIYYSFWKKWLKYRLNASTLKIVGYFTDIEVSKMIKSTSIYMNNQLFRIATMEYTETTQLSYKVTMQIESVTY